MNASVYEWLADSSVVLKSVRKDESGRSAQILRIGFLRLAYRKGFSSSTNLTYWSLFRLIFICDWLSLAS